MSITFNYINGEKENFRDIELGIENEFNVSIIKIKEVIRNAGIFTFHKNNKEIFISARSIKSFYFDDAEFYKSTEDCGYDG